MYLVLRRQQTEGGHIVNTFQCIEKIIEEKYDQLWSQPNSINRNGNQIYQGWHFGLFSQDIRTNYDAMLNMNTYIANMLHLSEDSSKMILDAGCGVGGTLITLAKKYQHNLYHGISLAMQELQLAENIKQKEHLNNVFFKKTSYLNTGFSENSFDCVYSLESVCYAEDKYRYIKEMKKILKPNGRLLVVDIFINKLVKNTFFEDFNHNLSNTRKTAFSRVTIKKFITFLRQEGFSDIQLENLSKQKHVRSVDLYGFMILELFSNLRYQIHKIKTRQKMILMISFPHIFFIKLLRIILSRPKYYAILAKR